MAVLFFYARKFRWNEKNVCRLIYVPNKVVGKVNPKEKMLELIKKKQTGDGRSKQQTNSPKNDIKNMRKGPKIFNK